MDCSNKLFDAVRREDAQLLRELLRDGESYSRVNEKGYTVMHYCADIGNVICLNAILDAARKDRMSLQEVKTKLCGKGKDGTTPYMLGRCEGHNNVADVIRMLFKPRGNLQGWPARWSREINCDYCERIEYAPRRGGMESSDEYFSSDGESMTSTPPLHAAIARGSLEQVEQLLRTGADVNVCDKKNGETALHRALRQGHEEIFRRLIEENCDLTIKDKNGSSVLHLAAGSYGNEDVIKLVLRKIENTDNAQEIALSCCLPDNYSVTPLSYVVGTGMWEIFELVTDLCGTWIFCAFGETPLHVACQHRDLNGVQRIINKFPELIHIVNADNHKPVHFCAEFGDIKMLDILIEAGDDLNSTELETGCTLLHFAAGNSNTEILEYLLEKLKNRLPM